MRPVDLYFRILEENTGIERGDFEVQIGEHGEVISVFLGGVRVTGKIDVNEFVEVMLGQGYLVAKAQAAMYDEKDDACSAAKRMAEYALERKVGT